MLDFSTSALNEQESKYKLPEPPDEIIDAAIMAAYQDTLENPPTPEEEARFQIGLRKLIDMFSKPSDDVPGVILTPRK